MAFNPIVEDRGGNNSNVKWSTTILEQALKGLEQGRRLVKNPFYDGKTYLLKGDIVFTRTKEEVEEWKRCSKDILYFAESYCKLMTPEGIKSITLRDYQKRYLKHLQDHRLSIYLACRQCGKCTTLLTTSTYKIEDHVIDKWKVRKKWSKYCIGGGIYKLPLFELLGVTDRSVLGRIRYVIYEYIYTKHDKTLYNLLQLIDLHTRSSREKLIKSFNLYGVQVLTDKGYKPVSQVHLTKAYDVYKVELEGGYVLECADNHLCFTYGDVYKYVKDFEIGEYMVTDKGPKRVLSITKLDRCVCMGDVSVDSPDHRYYTNGILSHNTTTSAIFLLWFILFNTDKNALVLGNKGKTAKEILSKVKKIFEALPFFLKPGIYKWNETEIVLDNGCMCMAEVTTINSGISFTFHCVLADEFAHIQPNIKQAFYENLFPVITAARARFMITSTQNGTDLFCQLYTSAKNGESEYAAFETTWDEVPEWDDEKRCWVPRDEKWHRMQVGNLGSEEAFQNQFGTSFTVSSKALVSGKIITERCLEAVKFVPQSIPGLEGSDYFFWKPGIDIYDLINMFLVITIDISEGINQDSTVATFNRIVGTTEDGRTLLDTIGYMKTNEKDDLECCTMLYNLCRSFLRPEQYVISLEYNLYGELWLNHFKSFIERDNPENFSMDSFVKYYNENMTRYQCGVRITSKSKAKMCKLFKTDFERGYITNTCVDFLSELRQFGDVSGNGTYKAMIGHDDMVMSQMQVVLTEESLQFKHLLESFIEFNPDTDGRNNINLYEDIHIFNNPENYIYDDDLSDFIGGFTSIQTFRS